MGADRFTLGKLFAMELHRFTDTIAEIIACAVKELYIEKCIKELTEVIDCLNTFYIKSK
jgi:dynein heavy chain